jgi:hypothetical protein
MVCIECDDLFFFSSTLRRAHFRSFVCTDTKWTAYDGTTTKQIEDAFAAKKSTVRLTGGFFSGKKYQLTFSYEACDAQGMSLRSKKPVHVQTNLATDFERQVRRRGGTGTEAEAEAEIKKVAAKTKVVVESQPVELKRSANELCSVCMDGFVKEAPAFQLPKYEFGAPVSIT